MCKKIDTETLFAIILFHLNYRKIPFNKIGTIKYNIEQNNPDTIVEFDGDIIRYLTSPSSSIFIIESDTITVNKENGYIDTEYIQYRYLDEIKPEIYDRVTKAASEVLPS